MKVKLVKESLEEGLFSRGPKDHGTWENKERGFRISDAAKNIMKKEPITGPATLELTFSYIGKNWMPKLSNSFYEMSHEDMMPGTGNPPITRDYKIIHADKEVDKTVVLVEVDILDWYEFVHVLDTSGYGLFRINKLR